jgi:methylenetetrahydrofolate dehydrogenase (NADP+)/methenyltetrahydrofolate cyclohydrolase
MTILDGKKLSEKIKNELKKEVEDLKKRGITPGLAVILVGNDPASHTYVKMKKSASKEIGINSIVYEMPENVSEEELLKKIDEINENPDIHGLLIQLPLPKHIDTTKILERVNPKKDVDGFHPYNMGRLVEGLDTFAPCTPLGVMEIFKEYNIDLKGKDVCVVGASNIVGKPMWALLVNAWATVDICHIETRDLAAHTKRADIVIVGVGKPNLITADMVKEGVIVVDIGINRLANNKIVGDVDFENVSKKASYITPVPGGVGPMTIAMLLKNTVKAAKNFLKEDK